MTQPEKSPPFDKRDALSSRAAAKYVELQERLRSFAREQSKISSSDSFDSFPHEEGLKTKYTEITNLLNARDPSTWSDEDDRKWRAFLDVCENLEVESLMKTHGFSKLGSEKLVKRGFVDWDTDSGGFTTTRATEHSLPAVEVLLVQRDGTFRIHPAVFDLLWLHPRMISEIRPPGPYLPHEAICDTIRMVSCIEEQHDITQWQFRLERHTQKYSPGQWKYILPKFDQAGPDAWAAVSSLIAVELKSALINEHTDIDQIAPHLVHEIGKEDEFENLDWMNGAISSNHFWHIINVAIELGRSLQNFETFSDPEVSTLIRKSIASFPGKPVTSKGLAIEAIVRSYLKETSGAKPTPVKILEWLKLEKRPYSNTAALEIDHELWGEELKEVSFLDLRGLIKRAVKRINDSKILSGGKG